MTEETKVQDNGAAEAEAVQEQANSQESQMGEIAAIKPGDVVKGKVVKVEDNLVLVDIGYKYDGIIPIRELSSLHVEKASDVVKQDEEVSCKVVSIDDEKEKLVLSKRAIDGEKAWDVLQQRLESGEVFEAVVADVVKGGLVVDVGVRGFIPASMVERHFVEDFSDYKGKTLRLKVKEVDKENNKLILSQKDVLDEEFEAGKQQRLSELKVDEVIEGTVQRLTPFGVFVDIGGVDGLVHISELAWEHVKEASDVVKEGDKVKVKVLKVDPANERISLSMKAVQPGPWDRVQADFNIGDIVKGTVKRLVSFGAFVEIAPGVEGLVHVSQIAHRHVATPHEVLKENQEVQVKILDINIAEKRVSLSIKETEEAPAAPERPERKPREEKIDPSLLSNQGLSLTLGERFGDKLSKFK